VGAQRGLRGVFTVRSPMSELPAIMPPDQITSRLVLGLFAYWGRLRGERLAPSWPEIDPAAIKGSLPYLLVSEIVAAEPVDLRFRLVGSEVVASYGYDPTGTTLLAGSHPPASGASAALYSRLLAQEWPIFGQYAAQSGQGEIFRVDTVTLPLSRDGQSISHVIELEDWSMAPGARRGQIAPDAWRFEILD